MRKFLQFGMRIFREYGLEPYISKLPLGFLTTYLKSNVAEVLGHKMFLDKRDDLGLSIFGIHESFITKLFERLIKPDDIVVDIGANIGYYTLLAARLVGSNGKVFSFEPEPTNFSLLEKNVRINGYQNVILVRKVVSDKTGKAKLFLGEGASEHSLYKNLGNKFIEVETVSIDEYLKDIAEKINLVKIDAEGSEGRIIKGMSALLQKNRNIKLMVEFSPGGIKKSGIEPQECLKMLLECGLKIYEVDYRKKEIRLAIPESLLQASSYLLCVKNLDVAGQLIDKFYIYFTKISGA